MPFKHSWTRATVTLLVLLAWFLTACKGKTKMEPSLCADDIYIDGRVYTLSGPSWNVEAFSVKDGKFLSTGTNREISAQKCDWTAVHDLEGRTVLPGLIDSHAHLLSLGLEDSILDLRGAASAQEVAAAVGGAAEKTPPGQWIVGRGWDQNLWPEKIFPTKELIDEPAGDHPAMLERIDGHAAWLNSRALELAGITSRTPDPEGGKIFKGKDGEPTGVLLDGAITPVERIMPPPSRKEKKEAIRKAVRNCLSVGLTMVHDAGIDGETAGIYRELIKENDFPFRVYAMIGWDSKDREDLLGQGPVAAWKDRLWLRAVKFFLDGALGSRGAALLQPYSDDPGNTGIVTMKEEEFAKAAERAVDMGFQPAVHAIGDRGVRVAIGVYSNIVKKYSHKDIRLRIEHTQVVSEQDIPKIGKLGIIASMQPIHCTSDMGWAGERLGPERAKFAYAWRKIIDSGAILASGSDAPVESPNPFWGIYAAVTRQDRTGRPPGGWYPENRMTLDEAVKSFTHMGARASFSESLLGSIEKGKFADFIVLDRDIFSIPPEEIFKVSVLMTAVGGKVAFRK
jgi:predicted amidohydrolase YtcJ